MTAAAVLAQLQALRTRVMSAQTHDHAQSIFVDGLHNLVAYDQAVLFGQSSWPSRISAVGAPKRDAPYVQSLRLLHDKALKKSDVLSLLSPNDLGGLEGFSSAHGIWVPLHQGAGLLLLSKSATFHEAQGQILELALQSLQHALFVDPSAQKSYTGFRQYIKWTIALPVLLILFGVAAYFVQIPNSVIVTTQIISDETRFVRAPIEGVIDNLHVQPGEAVHRGQLLASLDMQRINSALTIAQSEYDALAIEFEQESLAALSEPIAPARLATLRSQLAEKREQIEFLKVQQSKHNITAPISGIVIISSIDDLRARPVQIGEALLEIADPENLAIEALLDVSGAVEIEPDSTINVFPNSDPLNIVTGTVRHINPRATVREDGRFAFRIKAEITSNSNTVFLGQKGYGRIDVGTTNLIYFMFAKPLSFVRQTIGV